MEEVNDNEGQPCGSWRVVEWFEGNARSIKWCGRKYGPCPFPNTASASEYDAEPCDTRLCAVVEDESE